jgi:hypothetical protein
MAAKKRAKAEDATSEKCRARKELLRLPYWFCLIAYVADSVGILGPTTKLKLTHLAERSGKDDWKRIMDEEELLEDSRVFLTSVCALGIGLGRGNFYSLRFVVEGMGCPAPREQIEKMIKEVLS